MRAHFKTRNRREKRLRRTGGAHTLTDPLIGGGGWRGAVLYPGGSTARRSDERGKNMTDGRRLTVEGAENMGTGL